MIASGEVFANCSEKIGELGYIKEVITYYFTVWINCNGWKRRNKYYERYCMKGTGLISAEYPSV